jgi:hypothetical protein
VIKAFVVLKENYVPSEKLAQDIKDHMKKVTGSLSGLLSAIVFCTDIISALQVPALHRIRQGTAKDCLREDSEGRAPRQGAAEGISKQIVKCV